MSKDQSHKGAGRNTWQDYDRRGKRKVFKTQLGRETIADKSYNPDESKPLQRALQKIRDHFS